LLTAAGVIVELQKLRRGAALHLDVARFDGLQREVAEDVALAQLRIALGSRVVVEEEDAADLVYENYGSSLIIEANGYQAESGALHRSLISGTSTM